MIAKLSLMMITKNAEELLDRSLRSCQGLVDEIVIVDNYSKDKTREIAKSYGAKIYLNREENLGRQRAYGLRKVTGEWVLVLDSDEIISAALNQEINSKLKSQNSKPQIKSQNFVAFKIPFQNHFLGRPIKYGGESYRMLRLFRKDAVRIRPALVHEHFELKRGEAGQMKQKICHYSYRSVDQVFRKFTDYAIAEARQKARSGEKTSLKKIFLYPIHMFWARYVKDKGYKDGIFRIPLDAGFAYMEFLTYFLMLFLKKSTKSS